MTKQRVEQKAAAPPVEPTRITALAEVPVAAVDDGRNVRMAADVELVKSIKALGLLQPIVVREKDGGYELVAGRRRLEAVKALGWETIPAVVHGELSDDGLTAASLSENVERRPLSPIEEAVAINTLLEDGWPVDAVAALWARSDRWVADRLALLTLPDPIKQRLAEGAWPVNVGLAILRASDEKAIQRALKKAERGEDADDILRDIQHSASANEVPEWLRGNEKCKSCTRRGGNMPALFEEDWRRRDEEWTCYDAACLGQQIKNARQEFTEKAKKQGLVPLVFEEYCQEHGRPRSVYHAEECWPTLGAVSRAIGAEKYKEECESCPKRGLVFETGKKVCADLDCYKKKLGAAKRAEKKTRDVAKDSPAPADLYADAVRERIHTHERRWLEEQLASALAMKKNRRILEAVILARAFEAVAPPLRIYDADIKKSRALWKDVGLSTDADKLLHEVIQMDDAAREKLRLKTAELALRKGFDAWPYAAGVAAGVQREAKYELTDEFLAEAGFTKKALVAIAKEQKVDVKPTAKKAEAQKAVASAWPPGQLPKVVAEDWRHHLKLFAPPAPKKRAAKAKPKRKARAKKSKK